jgi:uncharacterized protein (TIGR02452 family)
MKPNELIKIADETVNIIDEGKYVNHLNEEVDIDELLTVSVNGGVYYPQSGWESPAFKHILNPDISVTEETTGQAAQRLIADGIEDVVVLNFASARRPGGGWLEGARAQEEDLARCSALGYCLSFEDKFYSDNKANESGLYTDGIIYSPVVPFFRDRFYNLTAEPYAVSVITSPAPNVTKLKPGEEQLLPVVLQYRARRILEVAARHEHDTIVLGAWGCGVFGNEAVDVTKAFREALKRVPAFKRVVFAVYDTRKGQPVLDIFKKEFGG